MSERRTLVPEQIEVMDDEMATLIRSKTGAERLQIASGLYSSARQMLVAYLRSEHPNWTEAQVQYQASRRMSHGAI